MLRAFQWDLARQVERLDHLLGLLPRYADWGYDRLYLHLEDAVDYPSLPGVARADAYGWRELEKLVAAASAYGIKTVPIANLLGHTQYIVKTPAWRDLNELRDPVTGAALATGQICPLHPRTPELVDKLFHDLAPLCTAGEIHAGLDESFHLGKHPLAIVEIAEVGLATHFARHVARLHAAAARRGLRLGLWADMLALLPAAIPQLPQHSSLSAYDWYYHPFARQPRMELYNFNNYDLAPSLATAGIAYWACPMNGAFRHESAPVWTDRLQNIAAWHRRAHATSATGFLMTSWEPYRLSLPTTTLMDAAAATLWLEPSSADDPSSLLAAGLKRFEPTIGTVSARSLARRLLATDAHAFCGNSRWEINHGWAPVAGRRDSPRPHARAARALERLASPPLSTAVSALGFLSATLHFQSYLARREVFVRTAASLTNRIRRHADSARATPLLTTFTETCLAFAADLHSARTAARQMWTASRPAATFATSPNARLLADDTTRLRTLRAWLRATSRDPKKAFLSSPVIGRWTLRFTVHHFAPCHQKLVVEQQQPDGTWRELHARVLIEFRAATSRPRTPHLRFEFAVPVENPDAPLRIAARCLGEFDVSHLELTDGVTTRQHHPLRTRHRLGTPAPTSGWPKIDWLTNTGVLELIYHPSSAAIDKDEVTDDRVAQSRNVTAKT